MKNRAIFALFFALLFSRVPLSAAQLKEVNGRSFVSNAHISVIMETAQDEIRVDGPAVIAVIVTNTESNLVSWEVSKNHPAERLFRYSLYFNNSPVETTPLLRMLQNEPRPDDPPMMEAADSILFHIEPSETITYEMDLRDLFYINQPGSYTLKAERIASDGKNVIRPEPLTFSVLPN